MVIYEVNLVINEEVYSQFQLWLKKHATEMTQFPGFIQANILKPENEKLPGKEKLTVQYQLENRKALDFYFEKFAAIMRKEGINLFSDKFSVERRIYEVEETIIK
jgi:antibiotic biosynthesis monooxygenase (ABM) superfamily enzyme